MISQSTTSYEVYFRRESNVQHLGDSTLAREIFHIMCTDAFLVFQAHSSGHILMGVILPRILFKCRSYSALGSPLSLHPTSFLPPPSERPSLPRQSPQAQSVHAPLKAVAISAAPSSAHITPAVAHPGPVALPILPQPCRATSLYNFLEPPAQYGPLTTTATRQLPNVAQPTHETILS